MPVLMRIYSTLDRAALPLETRVPGVVTMYVCGPTVQAAPHLGHGRQVVVFDVLRRYLEWNGNEVVHVQNITDVEDKIIKAAAEEDISTSDVVDRSLADFVEAYRMLGVLEPTISPRATDHIAEMIELIEELIQREHAYESGGDVYFSVRSYPGYGRLSGHDPDDLLAGARVESDERKRDPLDFALWKAAKPGEPHWESPWGSGRPGWHIECSAMARRYLDDGFDIHGGGSDLIFPHHENEIAQSEAAGAEVFARYWVHNGMVNLSGDKMAKSTGNVVGLLDVLRTHDPVAVRFFYLRTHYRKPLDFTPEALDDAEAALARLWSFRRRSPSVVEAATDEALLNRFLASMDDDLDVAGGLGVLFEAVREGNKRLDAGEDAGPYVSLYDVVTDVLGIREPIISTADIDDALSDLARRYHAEGPSVADLLASRDRAREAGDYATADGIRDELSELGVVVEDTADGSRWHRG